MRIHLSAKERRARERLRNMNSLSGANTADVALLERDYESDCFDLREYQQTLERDARHAE